MKQFIATLALITAAFALISFNAAHARAEEQMELSSQAPKVSKSQQIRAYAQNCFDQEISLFESTKGRLPSDEEADFIIDACANPKLK
jgi:hypothetical protein